MTAQLLQFKFFECKFIDAQVAFRVETPQQFASVGGLSSAAAEHRGEEALQPTWASARPHPTIHIRRTQRVAVQPETPARSRARGEPRKGVFRNLAVPFAAEGFDALQSDRFRVLPPTQSRRFN